MPLNTHSVGVGMGVGVQNLYPYPYPHDTHTHDPCGLSIPTLFPSLKNGDGSSIGLLGGSSSMVLDPVLELQCHPREIPRDRDCRIFGTMMREKLTAALKEQQGMAFIRAFTQFLLFYCFKSCMASRAVIPRRWSGKSYLNLVCKHHLVVTD